MILIIDFGSQYNQLIARRVREAHVYCQIVPPDTSLAEIKRLNPEGIILSGGPASVYEKESPKTDKKIFDLGIPVLGICYGMHFMIAQQGGTVKRAERREYGFAQLNIRRQQGLFTRVARNTKCWMSHGDSITRLPEGFSITASTENTRIAAVGCKKRGLYGLQFHPEVEHTPRGK